MRLRRSLSLNVLLSNLDSNINKKLMIRNAVKENSVIDLIEDNHTFCTFNKNNPNSKAKKTYSIAMKSLHNRLHNG
jgi:hypothetical protein